MHASCLLPISQTFNSYSSSKLAEIAARVVEEFRAESYSQNLDDLFTYINVEERLNDGAQEQPAKEVPPKVEETEAELKRIEEEDADDDDDFEFPAVTKSSPTSADDIFYNGQIRPMFPVFGRDFFLNKDFMAQNSEASYKPPPPGPASIRLPLRNLLMEERDSYSRSSSSETDELDSVQPGTYCVWTPKKAAMESSRTMKCKKSNSTGSSKRWKFRDLLHRSNSKG